MSELSEILEIKKYPEKILREKSQPIEKITEKEVRLFEDMLVTMHNFSGIGLAAPQIGVNQNLIVADTGEGPLKLANPELIQVEGKDMMREGCLSVPGALVNIERPYEVVVQGLNEKGEPVEIKAKGLMARVLLHEIDHLQGKLIIDHMGVWEKIKFKLANKRKQKY